MPDIFVVLRADAAGHAPPPGPRCFAGLVFVLTATTLKVKTQVWSTIAEEIQSERPSAASNLGYK